MNWRRFIPTQESLMNNRWLKWLTPWLAHPKLWHWSRRGVALGVALGVFFGLLIPIAQIPITAAAAVILRANLPVLPLQAHWLPTPLPLPLSIMVLINSALGLQAIPHR